ncbi:MAG: DUF2510 domain-containing protein [Actinobacteria bacterium]|nr:DUF2510 domain-containing protein [Actinomycetota bacterium]
MEAQRDSHRRDSDKGDSQRRDRRDSQRRDGQGSRAVADDEVLNSREGEVAPGWYADPSRRSHTRWHDGQGWTSTIALDGAAVIDTEGLAGFDPSLAPVSIPVSMPVSEQISVGAKRPLDRSERRALKDARRAVRDAERAHAMAIAEAHRRVRDTEISRSNQLQIANTQLAEAESPSGKRIGEYRGVVLHERTLTTPKGGTVWLRGCSADVESGGNLSMSHRPTLTRMAAGGLLFGGIGMLGSLAAQKREVADKRELYLLIQTGEGGMVLQCPPDDGLVVRQFAMAINAYARDVDANDVERAAIAASSRSIIARIEGDTSDLDEARDAKEAVAQDPAHLEAIRDARAEMFALEAGSPQSD